jgi:transcription elongation factor Elf1
MNLIELATVFTGCFECDHEAQFHGTVDEYDTAHFPCGACGQTFTIADWSDFFDDEEDN